MLKLNQAELAVLMGFSYQQMQKYEAGASQVSAGKLLLFSKILNVPPSYFYEGIKLEETIGKRIETNVIQKGRTEPLRILLVEHNPADAVLFKKALGGCSEQTELQVIYHAHEVMDYLNSREPRFGQKLPDLIVLDINMPRAGGIDLLKALKKNIKTIELPVVIWTNSINVRDMIESYRQGAAGFIQKSVDAAEYKESMEVVVKYWGKIVALPCAQA